MEKASALRYYAKYIWKLAEEADATKSGPMSIGAHTALFGGLGAGAGAVSYSIALHRAIDRLEKDMPLPLEEILKERKMNPPWRMRVGGGALGAGVGALVGTGLGAITGGLRHALND
jgi:hypothetical protein